MGRRQGNISSFFQPMAAHKARGDDVDSTPEKHSKTGADNGEETAGSMFYGETRPMKVVGLSQRVEPLAPHEDGYSALQQSPIRRKRRVIEETVDEPIDEEGEGTTEKKVEVAVVDVDHGAAKKKLLASAFTDGSDMKEDGSHSPEKEWSKRNLWTSDIHDSAGRDQSDPNYDPTTLRIPKAAYEKLTPFQKQFWDIKKEYFDVLLMFKKGKFYEMYDRDADIGAQVLNLNYTGGGRVDMRCVGVPEQAFAKHCSYLAEAGYKVGRVEQVETFNAAKKRRSSMDSAAKSQICKRALVKILTKGTVTDDQFLPGHQSRYVLAIKESTSPVTNGARMGVCYVDVAANSIHIGEFDDDYRRTWLETLITQLQPKEIILNALDTPSERLAQALDFYKTHGIEVVRTPGVASVVADDLPKYINDYFHSGNTLAETAVGICRKYLSYLRIEKEIFSLGNFTIQPVGGDAKDAEKDIDNLHLVLDAETLSSLEVLAANSDGSERGALISFVDRTLTYDGKRLLRKWLAKPLYSARAIEERLNAVDALATVNEQLSGEYQCARSLMAKLPDIERSIAKIHAAASVEDNVVMFDDTNKRKVLEFVRVVKGLQMSLEIMETLQRAMEEAETTFPPSLQKLLNSSGDILMEAHKKLSWFSNDALDFAAAENGEVKPLQGEYADEQYNSAHAKLRRIEQQLEDELDAIKRQIGLPSLLWFHRGKERYQVEIPISWLEKKGNTLPSTFTCLSQSPKCKRYWTPVIQKLHDKRTELAEELEIEEKSVFQRVLSRFDADFALWSAVKATIAEVDCLMSLATVSRQSSDMMCRPVILPNNENRPVLHLKQSRHPLVANKLSSSSVGSFVPNDIDLGGEHAPIVLLTGPNMGGKSTLLRQTCLAVVLAQIGCYVPAEECTLTPVDRIFTRIGAHDNITRGQSTFMVEMEETALLLNCATSSSLLILDELGRGTSTFDGYAIAYAVLDEIARRKCRTMFSTHYHMLTEEFAHRDEVSEYEMAGRVDQERKDVTFLYKFVRGVAPFSRGIHCARLARIPSEVTNCAEQYASQLEKSLTLRMQLNSHERTFAGIHTASLLATSQAAQQLRKISSAMEQ